MAESKPSYAKRLWARLDGSPDPEAYIGALAIILCGVMLGLVVGSLF